MSDLVARIGAALQRDGHNLAPLHLRHLPGGHSGVTWIGTFEDPQRRIVELIVKSAPAGRAPIGRHDVLRQARVLMALRAVPGIPVPAVWAQDDGVPPFFAMDRIDGCTGEPVLDEHPLLDPPSTIPAVWKEAIDMLAALGALDPSTLGLAAREPVLGPAEELTRWAATARAAGEVLPPRAARLHDALARNVPAAERTSLVHGDYRIGNTVRAGGHIAGLIDWEIWSLGDTRADLGWLMLFCDTTSFPGIGREVPGTPSADDVLARYAAASGTMPQHMPWFHALACFKLAAVQAHNLRRHEEGRRPDSFLERFRASIERLLDVGLTRITGCAGQVGR